MNTFLPFTDFEESVRCLDSRRLNNQINECTVIYKALVANNQVSYTAKELRQAAAWRMHPATRMWRGHLSSLLEYRDACILEARARGIRVTTEYMGVDGSDRRPAWYGNPDLLSAYRGKLYAKDPEHYAQFAGHEDRDPFPYPVPSLEYLKYARRAEKCKTLKGKRHNAEQALQRFPSGPVLVEAWPEDIHPLVGRGVLADAGYTTLDEGIPAVWLSGHGLEPMSRVVVL